MREHLLLTGPPDSGKSHHVLEAVRERLRRGGAIRLLVPTATMAEHVRNLLAREGFVFRPGLVSTLAKFIESWVEDLPPVSGALLDFSIRRALERAAPSGFAAVAAFPGFRAALARSIEELASSGCDAAHLGRVTASAFQSVYAEVEKELAERGALLSGERLRRVAARIREQGPGGADEIFLDGFFSFTDPELDVIDALRRHARLTVTLPAWPGAEKSRSRLLEIGCREERCPAAEGGPETVLVRARTKDQELEEIAARVLERPSRPAVPRNRHRGAHRRSVRTGAARVAGALRHPGAVLLRRASGGSLGGALRGGGLEAAPASGETADPSGVGRPRQVARTRNPPPARRACHARHGRHLARRGGCPRGLRRGGGRDGVRLPAGGPCPISGVPEPVESRAAAGHAARPGSSAQRRSRDGCLRSAAVGAAGGLRLRPAGEAVPALPRPGPAALRRRSGAARGADNSGVGG